MLLPLLLASLTTQSVTLPPTDDATIYAMGTANGVGAANFTGRNSGGDERRTLLRFDVAGAVPAGATITSAELRMFMDSGQPPLSTTGVHRVTAEWNEGPASPGGSGGQGAAPAAGDVTWTHRRFPDLAWAQVGGDFVATASGQVDVTSGGVFYAVSGASLVADAQAMLDDPAANHGWIWVSTNTASSTAKRWTSKEGMDPAEHPQLVLAYTPGVAQGTAFCDQGPCPCGNDSPGTGCLNSTGAGATLTVGAGTGSVALDDLVLVGRDLPPGNTSILFMGGQEFAAPVTVGDGLGCTGGIYRYPASSVGMNGEQQLGALVATSLPGQIQAGDTRFFQLWARDVLCGPPPAPCPSPCSTNSSLSSGVAVTFCP